MRNNNNSTSSSSQPAVETFAPALLEKIESLPSILFFLAVAVGFLVYVSATAGCSP